MRIIYNAFSLLHINLLLEKLQDNMSSVPYKTLVEHYERCLDAFGAVSKGVDWPNEADLKKRFIVMLDLCAHYLDKNPIKILDLGCGYGALLDYLISSNQLAKYEYHGIDASSKMIDSAISKHPSSNFEVRDILVDQLPQKSFDFVVMNGLFTEKQTLSASEMESFFVSMITAAFQASRYGIAFNVMHFHVDWQRDDLYHLPFDHMAMLVQKYCGRHLSVRADYGLYEYTVYVYKQPTA